MTIRWVKHPIHGRYPCTSSDIDLYKKAGWIEEATEDEVVKQAEVDLPPGWENMPPEDTPVSEDARPEITRERLLEIASERGIEINKKWKTDHIRKVLDL